MPVLVMSGWLRFCLSMFCSVPGFIPLAFTNLEASFCPSSVSVLNKQDRGLTGDRLTPSIPPTARLWLSGAHPWRALEDWTVGEPEGIQRVSPASHFVDEDAGAQRERERLDQGHSFVLLTFTEHCRAPGTILDAGDTAGNSSKKTPPSPLYQSGGERQSKKKKIKT